MASAVGPKKSRYFFYVLLMVCILAFGFACAGTVSHAFLHASMYSVSVMPDRDLQECCGTGIIRDIASRKSTLFVVPHDIGISLFFALFVLVAVPIVGRHFSFYRAYLRDNPDLPIFNHLKLAFAHGILNPKVY